MARANRHYIPGHAWHITHRCHKKEFLLKFAKDRQGWLNWLFEAKKRYGIVILNYMATSNHIHLLIHSRDGGEIIPKSIQLAAGRTAHVTISPGNQRYPEICVMISKRDPATPNSLFAQCESMLSITPDSFVFVYSSDGIFVLPAISVVSLEVGGRPLNIYSKSLRHFMQDFLQCFLGDPLVSAVDDDTLRRVRVRAGSAMMLSTEESG